VGSASLTKLEKNLKESAYAIVPSRKSPIRSVSNGKKVPSARLTPTATTQLMPSVLV